MAEAIKRNPLKGSFIPLSVDYIIIFSLSPKLSSYNIQLYFIGGKELDPVSCLFFRELLELLFQATALVIDVLRTFFLIVLSILGPLCFAISVWDGFQSTLTQWFCRYIQIYLWLPVSDLFSTILAKIQVLMLQNDIEALQNDPNFSIEASNGVYIVFLIIGIIGYFTIPTVAGWIIQAGGGIGNYNRNVNTAGSLGRSIAGATAGNVAGRAGRLIKSGFKKR